MVNAVSSRTGLDAVRQLDRLSCDPPVRLWIRLLRLDGEIAWDVSDRFALESLREALLADEMGPVVIRAAEPWGTSRAA